MNKQESPDKHLRLMRDHIDIDQLVDDKVFSFPFDFLKTNLFNYKTYFFYFNGEYYDRNNKSYPFNELREINGDNFKMSIPMGDHREGILGVFEKIVPGFKL